MEVSGTTAALTYSRHLSVERIDQFCVVPDGCVNTEPLVPLLVFLMTGLVALILVATIAHIRSAEGLLETERARTRDERDAFRAFGTRIAALEVSEAATVGTNGGVMPRTPATDGQLERIKDVYRDTVMAVPHFEEEYDEPLRVNMAAEFSEEIAAAVMDGEAFTPPLKQALLQQTQGACTQRERFLGQLDREVEAIHGARDTLEGIQAEARELDTAPLHRRSFDDLRTLWDRVTRLEGACADVLADRQRGIHEQAGRRGRDEPTIQEYVYQSLPVTYPVLAAGAQLSETLGDAKRRIALAISRHP